MSFNINEPLPETLLIALRELLSSTADYGYISARVFAKDPMASYSESTIKSLLNGSVVKEKNNLKPLITDYHTRDRNDEV